MKRKKLWLSGYLILAEFLPVLVNRLRGHPIPGLILQVLMGYGYRGIDFEPVLWTEMERESLDVICKGHALVLISNPSSTLRWKGEHQVKVTLWYWFRARPWNWDEMEVFRWDHKSHAVMSQLPLHWMSLSSYVSECLHLRAGQWIHKCSARRVYLDRYPITVLSMSLCFVHPLFPLSVVP